VEIYRISNKGGVGVEFERKQENKIRKTLQIHIDSCLKDALDNYHLKYKDNIGQLVFYPLIHLEQFAEVSEGSQYTEGFRKMLSWFIKEMIMRGLPNNIDCFTYNSTEYSKFQRSFIGIVKSYGDYELSSKLKDMSSHGRYALFSDDGKVIELRKPRILNDYEGADLYYYGTDESLRFKQEENAANKITQYISRFTMWRKIERLTTTVDNKLLVLCEERVKIDFEKMGGRISSNIINDYDNFISFISYLYYLAQTNLHRYKFGKLYRTVSNGSMYTSYSYEELVQSAVEVTGVPKDQLISYIGYLTFNNKRKGTLAEYPLLQMNNKIIFIPSNILLNDWSFSITNGHYLHEPKIVFANRKETISISIIENIKEAVAPYSNILLSTEYYYEYDNKEGRQKSDIDVAIFDIDSNCCLVLECKWLERVFAPSQVEARIYGEFNEIFKDQVSKHQEYLSLSKDHLSLVFENHADVVKQNDSTKILFALVDKRVELHSDDKHLLSVYTLLTILKAFENKGKLQLDKVIERIESLKTDVKYENVNEIRTVAEIGEYQFIVDGLFLDYKELE